MGSAMRGEEVTVLPRVDVGIDEHGNPSPTWPDPGFTVRALGVAPRAGDEDDSRRNREAVIVGLTVYLPADTPIDAVDHMRIRGLEYEVIGEPGLWSSPYSGVDRGIQVALERYEG